jgi:hypothetical protein
MKNKDRRSRGGHCRGGGLSRYWGPGHRRGLCWAAAEADRSQQSWTFHWAFSLPAVMKGTWAGFRWLFQGEKQFFNFLKLIWTTWNCCLYRVNVANYWQFYVVQGYSKSRNNFQTQELIPRLAFLRHCFASDFPWSEHTFQTSSLTEKHFHDLVFAQPSVHSNDELLLFIQWIGSFSITVTKSLRLENV